MPEDLFGFLGSNNAFSLLAEDRLFDEKPLLTLLDKGALTPKSFANILI